MANISPTLLEGIRLDVHNSSSCAISAHPHPSMFYGLVSCCFIACELQGKMARNLYVWLHHMLKHEYNMSDANLKPNDEETPIFW